MIIMVMLKILRDSREAVHLPLTPPGCGGGKGRGWGCGVRSVEVFNLKFLLRGISNSNPQPLIYNIYLNKTSLRNKDNNVTPLTLGFELHS
jgi:hypothetical protein